MFITRSFVGRCHAFLTYLNFKGKVNPDSLPPEEEDIAVYLHQQGYIKVKESEHGFTILPTDKSIDGMQIYNGIEPLVWHMAMQDIDEELGAAIRKNIPAPRPIVAEEFVQVPPEVELQDWI